MNSRAVRRIVVGVGLVVVFGIGVSNIIVTPAMQGTQNRVARDARAAETFGDQSAANSPAQNTAPATSPSTPPATNDAATASGATPAH